LRKRASRFTTPKWGIPKSLGRCRNAFGMARLSWSQRPSNTPAVLRRNLIAPLTQSKRSCAEPPFTREMVAAADKFREAFRVAHMDALRAADVGRVARAYAQAGQTASVGLRAVPSAMERLAAKAASRRRAFGGCRPRNPDFKMGRRARRHPQEHRDRRAARRARDPRRAHFAGRRSAA